MQNSRSSPVNTDSWGYFKLKFSLWGSSPHGCFFLHKFKKSWTFLHRTLEPLDILEDIPRLDVSDRLQSDIIQLIELATRYRKCQEPLAALVPLSKIKSFLHFAKCPTSLYFRLSTRPHLVLKSSNICRRNIQCDKDVILCINVIFFNFHFLSNCHSNQLSTIPTAAKSTSISKHCVSTFCFLDTKDEVRGESLPAAIR